MEQAHKPRGFFCAKGEANILRLGSGRSDEPLLAGLVADRAAGELEEVARGGLVGGCDARCYAREVLCELFGALGIDLHVVVGHIACSN
jgi:hypothetical protein